MPPSSLTDQDQRDETRQAGSISKEVADFRAQWRLLTLYQKFEHGVTLVLVLLIAIVVVAALWNLTVRILIGLVLPGGLDPADPAVFQSVFGMIFTVIIALEFKKSLLVVTERHKSIVHVRAVLVIALLAIVRKLIILDLTTTSALELFALSAAILALGVVYWLTRDQDRRERRAKAGSTAQG